MQVRTAGAAPQVRALRALQVRGFAAPGLVASLLAGARRFGLARHGSDVVEDREVWRWYQRRRMADEYRDDEW